MKNKPLGIAITLLVLLLVLGGAYYLYQSQAANTGGADAGKFLQESTTSAAAEAERTENGTENGAGPESTAAAESQTSANSGGEGETQPSGSSSAGTAETSAPDYTAPEIDVVDKDGNAVRLADFKGKTVVLNFWASWCPPCRAEFPDFQTFYEESKADDKVVMLAVNLLGSNGESKESAQAFIEENNYTLPYYFDNQGATANTYQVSSIPTTYIITPQGELFYRQVGVMELEKLREITQKAGE